MLGYATAAAVVVTLALVATAPATQEVVRAAIAAMVVENNVEREVPREVVARPIEGSYDPVPPLVEREIDDFHIAVSEDSQRTIFGGPTFGMRRGATISGRVVDAETGLPIYDICLDAENTDWDGPNAWGCTDANGRYTLQGVAPGTYRIRIQTDKENYVQEYYKGKLSWDYADLVTIEGTESVKGIDFGLKAGATISGRVMDAETGLPIARIDVSARPVEGDDLAWTRTDSDGNYILRGVPDGIIRVSIYDNGETSQGYIRDRRKVRIAEAKSVHDIGFSLKIGATISGRVVDAETGLPIYDICLDAQNTDRDGPNAWDCTDKDGRYALRGVAPGTYRVRAEADREGYVRQYYPGQLSWDDAELITVKGTESVGGLDFTLDPGATISGKVIDAGTGLPIANLEVEARPVDGDDLAWTRMDSNGNYTLRGLPNGRIEVSIWGQGYIEESRTVTIDNPESVIRVDF